MSSGIWIQVYIRKYEDIVRYVVIIFVQYPYVCSIQLYIVIQCVNVNND